jgi:multidrug resistance efflux pump
MGYDAGRAEFVARLLEIVASDTSQLARRNAACALAKSGEAAARPVLRSMLEPFTVTAPEAGVVSGVLGLEMPLEAGQAAAQIRRDDGAVAQVLAPVPGHVLERVAAEGAAVRAGDPLVVLGPDSRHAFNAAVGLALVGTRDDLELLGLASAPQSAFGADVKAAAQKAAEAIRARAK